jgi:hypothetical protein
MPCRGVNYAQKLSVVALWAGKSLGFKCPAELCAPDDFDFRQHHVAFFVLGH